MKTKNSKTKNKNKKGASCSPVLLLILAGWQFFSNVLDMKSIDRYRVAA